MEPDGLNNLGISSKLRWEIRVTKERFELLKSSGSPRTTKLNICSWRGNGTDIFEPRYLADGKGGSGAERDSSLMGCAMAGAQCSEAHAWKGVTVVDKETRRLPWIASN